MSNSKFTDSLYRRGITRFNLLKKKIEQDSPIEAEINGEREKITLNRKDEGVKVLLRVNSDEELQALKGGRLNLGTTDNRIIRLTQIYKDSIIGRDITAFVAEKATVNQLNSGEVQSTGNVEWDENVAAYVKKIKEKVGEGKFYHESEMKSLKEAYERCLLDSEYFAAGKGIAKWNPSDIWFQSKDTILDFSECKSLNELTDYVDELFDHKQLVGFSLKKITGEAEIDLVVPVRHFNNNGEETDSRIAVKDVDFRTESEDLDKVRSTIWIDYYGKSGSIHTAKLQFDIKPNVSTKGSKPQSEVHLYSDGKEAKQGQVNRMNVVGKILGIDDLEQQLQKAYDEAINGAKEEFQKWEENELPLEIDEDSVGNYIRRVQVAVANRFKEILNSILGKGVENLEDNKVRLGKLMSLIRGQFYSEKERSCKYYIIH